MKRSSSSCSTWVQNSILTIKCELQIKRENFMGKPMLFLNVMWKYLGQQSFHLSEQEYLEHLQALAELLVRWNRVSSKTFYICNVIAA